MDFFTRAASAEMVNRIANTKTQIDRVLEARTIMKKCPLGCRLFTQRQRIYNRLRTDIPRGR